MAINKEKNVTLQITFPKEDAEHLQVLKDALEENGIHVSKSQILLKTFQDYLKILCMNQETEVIAQKLNNKEDKKKC